MNKVVKALKNEGLDWLVIVLLLWINQSRFINFV